MQKTVKRTVSISLRTDVARKLMAIPQVVARIDQCATWDEAFNVLAEEATKRGFKTAILKVK